MDAASNLGVRQFLLPLFLQAESERGLAPVLPGVTTSFSYGVAREAGPPPPPPPPPAKPRAPTCAKCPSAPYPGMENLPRSASAPSIWHPPVADGFASSSGPPASSSSAPPGPRQQQGPPLYNQFSAFNGGSRQALGGRYVAYGQPPPASAPSHVVRPFPLSPQSPEGGELEEVPLNASSRSVM